MSIQMKEHKDKVNWSYISEYQKLSEKFIEEQKDKVDWCRISEYQKLSGKFIEKHKLKTEDNWNYLSTEEKKKKIVGSNQYKCFRNHFIAYKAVRSDRYSFFNFQYRYLKGKTYESHCDCTSNENSFGLSVWTENEAKNYNSRGIIIKVKIMYSDVGRIVHDNHKIRCKKFEVLS